MDAVGGSWVQLSWQAPENARTIIDRYIISTTRVTHNIVTMENTMSSDTSWNVTGLLPNIVYSFMVQAIAAALGLERMGMFSDAITATTLAIGNHVYGS